MKLLMFILSLTLAASVGITYAAPTQDNHENPTDPDKQHPGGRPKTPPLKWGNVAYDMGLLHITLSRPEGNCLVTITTGDMVSQTFTFDSEEPMPIFIGEVSYLSIIIETENGNIYHTEI